LLKHLGYVHRWAAGYVREQHPRWVDRASEAEILGGGPGDEALTGWFRDGHAALVHALEAADPGMTCWTFLEAPSPLAVWARRQAHETAIHRLDAQQAAAGAGAAGEPAFTPQFAADGVDELIMGFLGRDAERGSWDGLPGVLTLHADDGADGSAQWRVLSEPGGLAVTPEDGAARCEITRPAPGLYLLLWNRRDGTGPRVRGGLGTPAHFRGHVPGPWH